MNEFFSDGDLFKQDEAVQVTPVEDQESGNNKKESNDRGRDQEEEQNRSAPSHSDHTEELWHDEARKMMNQFTNHRGTLT